MQFLLYNLCTRSSPYVVLHVVTSHHVWLYIKCVVIHIYLYTTAFHSVIDGYMIMLHGVWLYVYFYIKGGTTSLTLHRVVIPLHVWLYIKHIVIHIYLFHYTACGYTRGYASRYTVISVYTRMSSIHT